MNTITKLAFLLLSILLTNSAFAETKLTANEVLKKTNEVYANCKSYMDTGYIKTVFMNNDGKRSHINKLIFSTSFIRPDKFRFEYAEKTADELQDKYIIWKDGKNIKSFWEIKGEEVPESLSMALAAATGVSGGTAHTIPSLLIKEVKGRLITTIKKPKLITEKKNENGMVCYLIKTNKNEILWIQKNTFLIVKIIKYSQFKDFYTESITVYKPQINIEIPAKNFIFKK